MLPVPDFPTHLAGLDDSHHAILLRATARTGTSKLHKHHHYGAVSGRSSENLKGFGYGYNAEEDREPDQEACDDLQTGLEISLLSVYVLQQPQRCDKHSQTEAYRHTRHKFIDTFLIIIYRCAGFVISRVVVMFFV